MINFKISFIIFELTTFYFQIQLCSTACPLRHYSNSTDPRSCQLCTICPHGHGTSRQCRHGSDTKCSPCTPGKTFQDGWGHYKFCFFCTRCGPHRDVISPCTATEDAKCGECHKGYYWDDINASCQPCSWCFPDLFEPSERYTVASCILKDIPEDYQCAKLYTAPYHQITFEKYRENNRLESGSGSIEGSTNPEGSADDVTLGDYTYVDDVGNLPSDDEDIPLYINPKFVKNALEITRTDFNSNVTEGSVDTLLLPAPSISNDYQESSSSSSNDTMEYVFVSSAGLMVVLCLCLTMYIMTLSRRLSKFKIQAGTERIIHVNESNLPLIDINTSDK